MIHNSHPYQLPEITRGIISALIFSNDNKLLMGKKNSNKGGVYPDCWHIPGGGIDGDEDKIIALQREIYEETNLKIESEKIELVDDMGRGSFEKTLADTGQKV